MVKSTRYSYRMSSRYETKYGRAGYSYSIIDNVTDQVISCWAVGTKVHVEKLAADYCDGMNHRYDKERLENKHQKNQTMKSKSYGHVTPSTKLRGIERA